MVDATNVLLVNDGSDLPDWGARATTRALIRLIGEAGGRLLGALPSERLRTTEDVAPYRLTTSLDRFVGGVHAWSPAARQLTSRLVRRPLIARIVGLVGNPDIAPESVSDFPRLLRRFERGEILRREREILEECDAVVINGQDAIREHRRDGRFMLFFAYLVKTHFRSRCVLVNHAVDLRHSALTEMAAMVYPMLDDVVFREAVSAEQCEPFLPDAQAHVAPDAAFVYEPADRAAWAEFTARPGYLGSWPDNVDRFDAHKPYVCVGASALDASPGRVPQNPSPSLERLCQALRRVFGQVMLTASCREDEQILRPSARRLGLPLIGSNTPIQQVVDILGNAALFVGGRSQPSVLALTGGTPVIGITSNHNQVAGILRMVGLDAPVFDAARLDQHVAKILELAKYYVSESDSLKDLLRNRASGLAIRAERNVASIAIREQFAERLVS
jgi:polysaccharide pyruvyl transferase WcaK-like protein